MPNAGTSVRLKEITAATVRAITDLAVKPEQERYVASNAVSIAQAYGVDVNTFGTQPNAADVTGALSALT